MTDLDLIRRLRQLRRTVGMLATELRQDHLDEGLLADIEQQMEHGIASDPRCAVLRTQVDTLRENTLTPRLELYADTTRACEQLNDAIEDVLDAVG